MHHYELLRRRFGSTCSHLLLTHGDRGLSIRPFPPGNNLTARPAENSKKNERGTRHFYNRGRSTTEHEVRVDNSRQGVLIQTIEIYTQSGGCSSKMAAKTASGSGFRFVFVFSAVDLVESAADLERVEAAF